MGTLQRWLPALAIALLGLWLVPMQHTCLLACIPGDLGDARFNGVVLEHFYRWLGGHEASLLSPTFFHPMPGSLTFSDNHWGSGWLYAGFRALGADRYQAFDLWYLAGFAANFAVTHLVFRRMQFSPWASAIGAFAFTFALPAISKHGHAQLTYRFLVPVGLLLWQRCLQDGRWRWFAALSLVVTLQLYLSIYLGWFLILLLAAWAVAAMLLDRSWPRAWLADWQQRRRTSCPRERTLSLVLMAAAAVAVALLMYPYLHYAKLYHFGRGLGEVSTLTPRLQSYLLADLSGLWGGISQQLGSTLPARQEHQLFFGVGTLGLALFAAVRVRSRLAALSLLSLLLLFLLTLTIDRYSLYLALAALPGVGAVRAVSRIALVMALPLALLVAMAVDAVPRRRWGMALLITALVGLMSVEAATYNTNYIRRADALERTAALQRQMPATLPPDTVLFNPLREDEPYYVTELDGVILAQERNLPTLNGYSGNYPPGYAPQPTQPACEQAHVRLQAAANFAARHPKVSMNGSATAPVWVLGQGPCATSAAEPARPADPRR